MDQYPSYTKASLSKIWCLECRGIVRERKRLNNSEVSSFVGTVSTVLYVDFDKIQYRVFRGVSWII